MSPKRQREYFMEGVGYVADGESRADRSVNVRRASKQKAQPAKPKHTGDPKSTALATTANSGLPVVVNVLQQLEKEEMWPSLTTRQLPDTKSVVNVIWNCLQEGIQVKFNEFDQRYYILIDDQQIELNDAALSDVLFRMHYAGCMSSMATVSEGLRRMGIEKKFHPVREYLDRQVWDGQSRLRKLLSYYFNAEDTELNSEFGTRWMIAAVRRVRQPGCKFDPILTLRSEQGTGKSTGIQILATPEGNTWFSDSLEIGASAKETIENTAGVWIAEFAELHKMNTREVEGIKRFASSREDRARVAFGRVSARVPRQFVCVATVNQTHFLRDDTGNRRFWIVEVGRTRETELLADRDQLWAEAAHREAEGEQINIPPELWPAAAEVTEDHMKEDPVADAAAAALAGLPDNDAFVTAADLAAAVGITDVTKRGGATAQSIAAGARRAGWKAGNRRLNFWELKGRPRYYAAPLSNPAAIPIWYQWKGDEQGWKKTKADPL
jgi:hypothetical protein